MFIDEDGFERDEHERFDARVAAHALMLVVTIALAIVAAAVAWRVFSPAV